MQIATAAAAHMRSSSYAREIKGPVRGIYNEVTMRTSYPARLTVRDRMRRRASFTSLAPLHLALFTLRV